MRKGIPHAYPLFEGEQHGFRKAETVVVALLAELFFYGQVLGFTPPGGATTGASPQPAREALGGRSARTQRLGR